MLEFGAASSGSASASYQGLANFSQAILAGVAVLALLGAAIQIRVTRGIAKRQLAYEYLKRFNSLQTLDLREELRIFWKDGTWKKFKELGPSERGRLLVIPNLIEELGALYNRRRLDRDVTALGLGLYIEVVWSECQGLILGCRGEKGEWIYSEWDEMRADTQARRERAHRKILKRRAWKNLFSGGGG